MSRSAGTDPGPAPRLAGLLRLTRRGRPPVGVTPADVVHRENKWRLLRYRARPEGLAFETPVLMVPSLINRHYVLDLMPGKSLVEWLVARGHDVFMVDWGTPGPEDRFLGFDDIVDRYLGRAVRRAARHSKRGQVHLLGYCLGGTLAVIHAARRPERVASLTALAAPVSFGDEGLLERWVRSETLDVDALVDGLGNVPWPLMQAAFHLLRPTLTLSKAVHVLDRAWDDAFLDGFVALETWGNDNVSFPGEAWRRYIRELYRDDALVRGELRVAGEAVRLESLAMPLHVVSFEHDNIVPAPSAVALAEQAGSSDLTHVHLPGGHVGAVVARKAAEGLWPALASWWEARDTGLPRRRRARS